MEPQSGTGRPAASETDGSARDDGTLVPAVHRRLGRRVHRGSDPARPAADAGPPRRPRPIRPLGPHDRRRWAGPHYDQNLSFPPVMAYIWGLLALVEPAFKTVTDSSEPGDPGAHEAARVTGRLRDSGTDGVRVPGTTGLGGARGRHRPVSPGRHRRERVVGPVREHLPVLCACGRRLRDQWSERASRHRRRGLPDDEAAGAPVPGAVRGLVLGARRWREVVRTGAIGLAVIVVLWLPFVAAGGPVNYLSNLADYQNDVFPYCRSTPGTPGGWCRSAAVSGFVSDQTVLIGRHHSATRASPSPDSCRSSSRS